MVPDRAVFDSDRPCDGKDGDWAVIQTSEVRTSGAQGTEENTMRGFCADDMNIIKREKSNCSHNT